MMHGTTNIKKFINNPS